MSKLTLSIDERVVKRAKRFAARQGVSVSRLVESYLELVSRPSRDEEPTPILGRLRGALRGVDELDYRRYLERKHR